MLRYDDTTPTYSSGMEWNFDVDSLMAPRAAGLLRPPTLPLMPQHQQQQQQQQQQRLQWQLQQQQQQILELQLQRQHHQQQQQTQQQSQQTAQTHAAPGQLPPYFLTPAEVQMLSTKLLMFATMKDIMGSAAAAAAAVMAQPPAPVDFLKSSVSSDTKPPAEPATFAAHVFQCTVPGCPETRPTRFALRRHLRTHTSRGCRCTATGCGKVFSDKRCARRLRAFVCAPSRVPLPAAH
jgi:TolA-binding protein